MTGPFSSSPGPEEQHARHTPYHSPALSRGGRVLGMAFKYLFTQNEIGVQIFGPLHGAAFVAYLLVTLLASVRLRWGAWATLVTLVASVPPLTTLVADWWLHRTGRLVPATEREPEPIA